MGMRHRKLLCSAMIPAALLLGAASGASAQDSHAHDMADMAGPADELRQARWSDPASWPDGKVPAAGDEVTIARDTHMVLDVSPPALRSLTVDGKLSFDRSADVDLTSEWIYLRGGELEIGTPDNPYLRKASITLTDSVPGEDINTMGDRGILVMSGKLTIHGDTQHTWSKLAATAEAGSSQIVVLDASEWQVGDEIVLASTDFNPRQAEKRRIAAISGNTITLDSPLDYMHFGEITFGVDQRGEVGLLTRNIKIQSSEDSTENYFGGHIMAMAGAQMHVSGVELYRMGQHMNLARYPIHWHLIGDGAGQYIQNSSVHNSYSRCVTVHGTDNARVENNVTYDTVGHCFFLEDAVETGNQFIANLGIQTKCHPTLPCKPSNLGPAGSALASRIGDNGQTADNILLPSDNTASTFWITNPDNIYRGNVAAGSDQIGFWFALPEHGIGQFNETERGENTWPRRVAVREFKDNTAHSNYDGFMFDRGPAPDNTFNVGGSNYHFPTADPTDPNSEPLVSHFENFTGYKNRNGAVWGRGEMHLFTNLRVADNAIGFTHAASAVGRAEYTSKVKDGIFVGESANIGNPTTEAEIAYGRSLPNDLRDAGAVSYLMYTSFGMSTENAIEGASFENAKPVSFPPYVRAWASDLGRANAWRGAAIWDKDGSFGGAPNSFVVLDNGIASDDEACEIKPDWGAAICDGDFGHFGLGTQMGFGNAPIEQPIMLSRNGRRWEYTGQTTIRSGADVRVETSRDELSLSLREMDNGSFVVFELPGFATTTGGLETASLEELRASDQTAFFTGENSLWVKLVVDNGAGETMQIGRPGFGVSTVGPGPGGAFDAGATLAVNRRD